LTGDGKVMEMKSISNQFTANVICSTAFGLDINPYKNPDDAFCRNSKLMFQLNFVRSLEMLAIFFLPEITTITGIKIFGKKPTAFVRKLFWETVNGRQSNQKRHDFVDILIELKKTYGDQDFGEFSK